MRLSDLSLMPHPVLYLSSAAQIELLQLLVQIASENNLGEGVIVKIKFNIIASLYDYNPNLATYMKPEMWQKCLDCINELMDILFANPNIFVGENILEESENLHNVDQPLRVRGCILTLVERMDEEFTKIMQNTDPHSQEYVEHLKDEAQVCAIIDRVQRYLEEKGTTEEICRIYLRRILHTYYKFDYKAHQRQLTLPEGSSKVCAWPSVTGKGMCHSVLHVCQDLIASLPFPGDFLRWNKEGNGGLG
ncbi:eukaryotic translation initiation factor 3 subunit C [Pteropus alecto]|nr:eukaryotic translation initiation factor 3 subunit C [Pteropus alecto]